MKLIITRHGQAEKEGDDSTRNLTDRGRSDMALMSSLIRASDWNVRAVLSSPVLRARQTAEIIARELKLDAPREEERLAPGRARDGMKELLDLPSNSDALVWVFHAPDVAQVASALTGLPESGFYFPSGTMLALNLPLPQPESRSMLICTVQPEYLSKFQPT